MQCRLWLSRHGVHVARCCPRLYKRSNNVLVAISPALSPTLQFCTVPQAPSATSRAQHRSNCFVVSHTYLNRHSLSETFHTTRGQAGDSLHRCGNDTAQQPSDMASNSYPPQYRQGGAYSAQQLAQYRTQQEQQQRARQAAQYSGQLSAAYYPSPEPSSNGSSPTYSQPSPTLYKSAPSGQQRSAQSQQQRRPSQYSSTSAPPKEPSWYCMYPEHQQTVFFARKADLKRHYDQVHNPESVRMLDCTEPRCHRRGENGFGRKDKLVEHQREVHKINIPKRGS